MWVDYRVIFEIENRERGIEKHREAAKTGFSYTGFRVQWCFLFILLGGKWAYEMFFVNYIYEEMGELVSCECWKRAFCNDKIDIARVREQLKLSDKAD